MSALHLKRLLAAGTLALAFLGGVALAPTVAGSAFAGVAGTGGMSGFTHAGPGSPVAAAAEYIGIELAALRDALAGGRSLAEVAVENGGTRDGLIDAMTAAARTQIGEMVDQPGLHFGRGPRLGHFAKVGLSAAADYLGISEQDLFAQLREDNSLAAIADATAGKSRDGLVAALTASAEAKIAGAEANGRITVERAAQMRANLADHIARMVDSTRPMLGRHR